MHSTPPVGPCETISDAALDEQDGRLRAEADALLRRSRVMDILRRFGTPHISGSYAMCLMTWRDLDIYLEMRPCDTRAFLELGRALGEALTPRKLSFTDHLHFPATEGLPGLYWGIRTADLAASGWKIDLWGVEPPTCAERLSRCESLAARVDRATRYRILRIKHAVCRLPEYRQTITSQQVYDAVLEMGVTTVEEFMASQRHRQEHECCYRSTVCVAGRNDSHHPPRTTQRNPPCC